MLLQMSLAVIKLQVSYALTVIPRSSLVIRSKVSWNSDVVFLTSWQHGWSIEMTSSCTIGAHEAFPGFRQKLL